jgi:hypothetical protein
VDIAFDEKAVEGSVVGDHVTIVEYLGLLLRSPT